MFGKRLAMLFVLCGFLGCLRESAVLAQGYLARDFLAGLGSEPSLGSADAAVPIVEFSDLQWGSCKQFWAETLPKLTESYIEAGKARFVYRNLAILGKPSEQAAQAAA